jgi:D-serine deaminase-like pyridoxal phosphate-dependent protein
VQLDQLEDDLRLSPAQLGHWRSYADKVQKLADDTARSRLDARAATSAPADAVQQLEQIAASTRDRAGSIDAIVEAGRVFYATLTPDQKVIADRRLWQAVSLLATGVTPPGMSDLAAGRGGRRSAP